MTTSRFLLQILPWILLGLWTLYALIALFLRKPKWKFTGYYVIQHIPSTFVTLGVLGTFAGVTYGLIDFNLTPDKILNSIPVLISGLTNAFYTSLYGLLLSILSGIVIRHQLASKSLQDPEEQSHKKLLMELNLAIDNFGENLAEYNSEAIVSSLENVIKDFNDTFTELIGELVTENFEKLNSSIDQLVEWQIEYREDINKILDTNKAVNERNAGLLNSFERINKNISLISESSKSLKTSLDSLRKSIDDESSLSGLITKLENATTNLISVSDDADLYRKEVERIVSNLVETQENIEGWLNKEQGVFDAANAMNQTLIELREFDITQIEKLDESFTNRLEETFQNLDRLMKTYVQHLEESNQAA